MGVAGGGGRGELMYPQEGPQISAVGVYSVGLQPRNGKTRPLAHMRTPGMKALLARIGGHRAPLGHHDLQGRPAGSHCFQPHP